MMKKWPVRMSAVLVLALLFGAAPLFSAELPVCSPPGRTKRFNQTFHHNTIYDLTAGIYPRELFRYANGIDNLRIYNNTFQLNNTGNPLHMIQMFGGTSANLDIKNKHLLEHR